MIPAQPELLEAPRPVAFEADRRAARDELRRLSSDVFDLFPFGIMVADADGRTVAVNGELSRLVGVPADEPATCCELFGCRRPGGPLAGACLTQLALATGKRLPELCVELSAGEAGAAWVTAAPLYADGSRVVFHVRPGDPADSAPDANVRWIAGPQLTVSLLGPTRLETLDGPVDGEWLEQRPGQLLRYLAAQRGRVVPVEEIAEAVWPNAGFATSNTVRHFIHNLREKLEPGRPKRAPSSFVLARHGGYTLNTQNVRVDFDEFERSVDEGLAALARGDAAAATDRFERALALYRGDFLADDPYAEWAFAERERLRALVEKPLRGLAELALRAGDLETAAGHMEQLAELEPFDSEIQRQLLTLWLALGRRSRAVRHFQSFQLRMLRGFGQGPDFHISDLHAEPGALSLI